MKTAEFKDIIYTKEEETGIVTITLNRPETKNSMTHYTFWELCCAVDAVQADDTARAVILTGAPPPGVKDPTKEAFSSGGYINPKTNIVGGSDAPIPQEAASEIDPLDYAQKRLTLKLFELDKPLVAALNGFVIGGGFTMVLIGADLIYASEHAWMQLPFVQIGLLPEFGSSYILPRMLGMQKAKEIIYFAKKLTAEELLELNLINGVVAHEELLSHAREQLLQLIPPKGPGMAVRIAKRSMHEPLLESLRRAMDRENDLYAKAFGTWDVKEFITSHSEKRKPIFRGC